jgi:hypothetical protein
MCGAISEEMRIYGTQSQVDYEITRDGVHLIVPVVMMVDGVHHGSGGPILHLHEYFGSNPESWNGVPVTAGHPEENGQFLSVNQAQQDQWVVGHVNNARVENGKLKADVWINQTKAIGVNPEVLNYILEGRRLEVSTGVFTQDENKTGEWEGENYEAVSVRYQPDHLALLPGEEGACNWSDGCGIRNNKNHKTEEGDGMKGSKDKDPRWVVNRMQSNEAGFLEIINKVQGRLDRMDSEARIHFLKELFDDHFVYEVRDRDRGSQQFFRQAYNITDDSEVDFTGDAQPVRRNVEFIPIQSNEEGGENENFESSMKRTKFNCSNNKQKEDATMSEANKDQATQPSGEVMDRVVALINNERTRFGKADRNWLLKLNEDQLDKLEPTEVPEAEITREQAIQTLSEDLSDTDKLKELVSADIKQKLETGLAAYKAERDKLIQAIQANTGDTWPTDKLEGMDTEDLERLAKSVRKVDYSGQNPVVHTHNGNANGGHMLLPAGIELED